MKKRIVFRDKATKKVHRLIEVEKGPINLIFNHETRRVEISKGIQEYKDLNIPYTLLEKTSFTALKKKPYVYGNYLEIAAEDKDYFVAKDIPLKDEDTRFFQGVFKWSAASHVVMLLLIFLVAWLLKPEAAEEEKARIVKITPQSRPIVRPGKANNVKQATRSHVTRKAKVSRKRPVKRPNTVQAKASGRKHNKGRQVKKSANATSYRTQGALGALKNVGSKGKNSKVRLGAANVNRTRVAGTNGGGSTRAVMGKALVKSQPGKGIRVGGTGSYSKSGLGKGGRGESSGPSFQGRASGYLEPLASQAIVRGGLTQDQIASVIKRNLGQVLYCYERGLQRNPNISGRVAVNFVISPRGIVSRAGINQSSVDSARVEGCIVSKLRRWSFPKPVGNVSVDVTYPFLLRRSS